MQDLTPVTRGCVEKNANLVNPVILNNWDRLETVNEISWVKSPYLERPPKGDSALGT